MSKAVPKDHDMNREELIALILRAKGLCSLKEFSTLCGIGTTALGKYVNGTFTASPLPTTLIRIANASQGRVFPEEILYAGGYEPGRFLSIDNAITPIRYSQNVHIALDNLQSQKPEIFWEIMAYGEGNCFDLWARVKQSATPVYLSGVLYFRYLYETSDNRQVLKRKLEAIYGQLCTQYFPPYSKFILVTNNMLLKDLAIDTAPPINLNIFVSIVLTDSTGKIFTSEDYLTSNGLNRIDYQLIDLMNICHQEKAFIEPRTPI